MSVQQRHLHLREFTADRLEVVRDHWRSLSGADEFDIELASLFDWCETHIAHQPGDSQARELYNDQTDQTDAILEVVDNKRGAKLLKLFLSPELWVIDGAEIRERVIRLHAVAFMQVITVGMANGSSVVKIYGRSELMFTILQELQAVWPSPDAGLGVAAMQGRWLAISSQS